MAADGAMKSAPAAAATTACLPEVEQGGVVIHAVVAQYTAVTVRGVFAKTGVGHHNHLRHGLFADARHTRDRFPAGIAACLVGMMRNTESHYRTDAHFGNAFDFTGEVFFRNAHDAPAWPQWLCSRPALLQQRSATPEGRFCSVLSLQT